MKIIYIVFCIIMVGSCSKSVNESTSDVGDDCCYGNELIYKLQGDQDTTINLPNGSSFSIQAHSFIDKQGNIVKDAIDLIIFEFNTISDFILNNLSTMSNGVALESGGMFKINAKRGRDTLDLILPISVAYRNEALNYLEEPKLFKGHKDGMLFNWLPDTVKVRSSVPTYILVKGIDTFYAGSNHFFVDKSAFENIYLFDLYFTGYVNIDKSTKVVPVNIQVSPPESFDASYLVVAKTPVLLTPNVYKDKLVFDKLPSIQQNELFYIIFIEWGNDEKCRVSITQHEYHDTINKYDLSIKDFELEEMTHDQLLERLKSIQ